MNYPFVLHNVLPERRFVDLYSYLLPGWSMNNYSDKESGTKTLWGKDLPSNDLPFLWAGVHLKYQVEKIIRKRLQLIRAHPNGQTTGQEGHFHIDYPDEEILTAVLFTQISWNTQWAGELVILNPDTKRYTYVPYIPNSAAVFPASWDHYGMCPNSLTDKLRTSIGFAYCDRKKINNCRMYEGTGFFT